MANRPASNYDDNSRDEIEPAPTISCDRNTPDVQVLVQRARHGDEASWEALFRRSYPKLLAYAARRLPTELAKDAVGETMIRAVAGIEHFQCAGGGFDAWMYGIARHVVIDAQRKSWREGPAIMHESSNPASDPEERVIEREDCAEVRAAFERLNRSDQELLELRVVAGLSADEVATMLGRRPGAVRMAQNRALSRLRTLLVHQAKGVGHA